MSVFVLAILIYLLYRFIAGFLIPVIRTTSHVRQQFNAMNKPHSQEDQSANGQGARPKAQGSTSNAQRSTPNAQGPNPGSGTSKVGEYIDFEEVK